MWQIKGKGNQNGNSLINFDLLISNDLNCLNKIRCDIIKYWMQKMTNLSIILKCIATAPTSKPYKLLTISTQNHEYRSALLAQQHPFRKWSESFAAIWYLLLAHNTTLKAYTNKYQIKILRTGMLSTDVARFVPLYQMMTGITKKNVALMQVTINIEQPLPFHVYTNRLD